MFSGKIESLGRLFITSSKYFPLEFLVRKLEVASCSEGGGDYTWVPSCLQNIGVDPPRLLDVYNRIYLAKVRVDPPRLPNVDNRIFFSGECLVDVWRRASYSPSFELYSRKLRREPGGRLTPGPQAVCRSFPGTFFSEYDYCKMICLCAYFRMVDVYCVCIRLLFARQDVLSLHSHRPG